MWIICGPARRIQACCASADLVCSVVGMDPEIQKAQRLCSMLSHCLSVDGGQSAWASKLRSTDEQHASIPRKHCEPDLYTTAGPAERG